MPAQQTTYSLGTLLLLGGVVLPRPHHVTSHYSARVSGALAASLDGSAEFGRPANGEGERPFVITLGANGEEGAVVLTLWDGHRPSPGTYQISAEPQADGVQVLVVTGSAEHPAGVFRPRRGTLTITSSSWNRLTGRFAMKAEGYLAGAPDQADQAVTIEGSFNATAGR
jgi:hypothetical protein